METETNGNFRTSAVRLWSYSSILATKLQSAHAKCVPYEIVGMTTWRLELKWLASPQIQLNRIASFRNITIYHFDFSRILKELPRRYTARSRSYQAELRVQFL